jgi:hypothetical protein
MKSEFSFCSVTLHWGGLYVDKVAFCFNANVHCSGRIRITIHLPEQCVLSAFHLKSGDETRNGHSVTKFAHRDRAVSPSPSCTVLTVVIYPNCGSPVIRCHCGRRIESRSMHVCLPATATGWTTGVPVLAVTLRADWLWGPPSLLSTGNRGLCSASALATHRGCEYVDLYLLSAISTMP